MKQTLTLGKPIFSDDMVQGAIGKTIQQLQAEHKLTPQRAAMLHKRALEVEAWQEGIGAM